MGRESEKMASLLFPENYCRTRKYQRRKLVQDVVSVVADQVCIAG